MTQFPRIFFEDYFSNVEIPDTWGCLQDFSKWYLDNRMPIMVPKQDSKVVVTDNATAITIFRHGRYQVEMYIVHPNTGICRHSHPGIELTMMQCGNSHGDDNWGYFTPVLESGEFHGGDNPDPENSKNGYLFLTFEKWDEDIPMTSAAVQWGGETHGPVQDQLIRESVLN